MLELHEHCYVSGPNANRPSGYKFAHSHADATTPHEHPDTGPAAYTIDRAQWYAATGLRGGGRRQYTNAPRGEQLAFVARTAAQQTFRVVFCDTGYTAEHERGPTRAEYEATRRDFQAAASGRLPTPIRKGRPGEGGAAVANLALTFGMTPIYEYDDGRAEPP